MSHQFSDQFEPQPQPKKPGGMKAVVVILAILGGVVVLGCGGCLVASIVFFQRSISDDPATVQQTAQSITEIEVPPDYQPMFSMDMFGMKMVGFGDASGDQGRIIVLMAFPPQMAADQEQMRQQMEQSLEQQTGQQDLEELESELRTYTVRGEEVQFRVAKVRDDSGRELRQVTGFFKAKNGAPAMLMIMMPEDEWNSGGEAKLEAMFTSMK